MRSFEYLRIRLYRLTKYTFAVPISRKLQGVRRFLEADDYIIRLCNVEEIKEMIDKKVLTNEKVLLVIPVYNNNIGNMGEDGE